MDALILTNALLAVGTGTSSADRDISNRLVSVKWDQKYADLDVTTMGSQFRQHAVGLGDGTLTGELLMSYSTGDQGENIDALLNSLQDLSATGKTFLVRLRPVNAAKNATNPEYTVLARMAERSIIDGSVGAVQKTAFSFLQAGAVSRTTASS